MEPGVLRKGKNEMSSVLQIRIEQKLREADNLSISQTSSDVARRGAYNGTTVPISPDEFKAILKADAASIAASGWALDQDPDVLIDMATVKYIYDHWVNWVALPLAGDAPQAVVDWQTSIRTGKPITQPVSDALTLEKRVALLEKTAVRITV